MTISYRLIVIFLCFLILGAQKQKVNPIIQVDFELVELGLKVFDLALPIEKREINLQAYLKHPRMQFAFQRYSDASRPPDNRIDEKTYEEFVRKVWSKDFASVSNPRLIQYVRDDYQWGINHLPEVIEDVEIVKKNIPIWIDALLKKIPFDTPAAARGLKPIRIVFLFDPGGSYPWVKIDDTNRYIYIDVLKLRGIDQGSKKNPVDRENLQGFLLHELFHLFQTDKNQTTTKSDWILGNAVAEGSAMLIGNNAPDRSGNPFLPNEPVLMDKAMRAEWDGRMVLICDRIKDFENLYEEWKKTPPTAAEFARRMTKDSWMASPENGLYTGDSYRVGAQMLMDIKEKKGMKAFYEVVGDSTKLWDVWKATSRCEKA